MSIRVQSTVSTVPNGTQAPATFEDFLYFIVKWINWTIQDSGPEYIITSAPPAPESVPANSILALLDPALRPLVLNLAYQGLWTPFDDGQNSQIKMFSGLWSSYFDSSGRGLKLEATTAGKSWWGWALCNGNNGTVDLRNRFIIMGQQYTAGQGWQTNVYQNLLFGAGGDWLAALPRTAGGGIFDFVCGDTDGGDDAAADCGATVCD